MLVRLNWLTAGPAIAAMAMVSASNAPAALAQLAPTSQTSQTAARLEPVMRDIPMGMADAPVEIVEYASVTCAACQHFQTDILPRLKARYILNGQAKFLLRDHPTPPAPLAFAGFALARCAGDSEFYAVIDDLFTRQTEMLAAARSGRARAYIIQIGAAHGLSEPDVEACIKDKALQAYIQKQLDNAPEMTVSPAVFVNGRRVEAVTYDAIAKAIDLEIAAAAVAAALLAPGEVTTPEPATLPSPPPTPSPGPG